MYCVKPENIAEHSHQVAIVAHLLAVIKNKKYNGNINADKISTIALYHEASETRYGDIVSPTKYANKVIAREFKKIELLAEQECLASLPDELQKLFSDIIVQDNVSSEYKAIVKAADIIVAYIKALDEINHKNPEFDHVEERLRLKIDKLKVNMPEVSYFIDTFMKACLATVDKLSEP
jgi:5'-deoxynucleotidase